MGYDASLRCPAVRMVKHASFHLTCFQPFFKQSPVHRNMGKQPVMADVIEAPFNIALQYPFGRYFLAHPQKNGLNGVMRAAHWSETIAVMVSSGLGYGFQSQQPQ